MAALDESSVDRVTVAFLARKLEVPTEMAKELAARMEREGFLGAERRGQGRPVIRSAHIASRIQASRQLLTADASAERTTGPLKRGGGGKGQDEGAERPLKRCRGDSGSNDRRCSEVERPIHQRP